MMVAARSTVNAKVNIMVNAHTIAVVNTTTVNTHAHTYPLQTSMGGSCAWGLFGCSVDQVKARLLPDLIAEHAEIFMINGDMQSNLYTASRAMHSHILNLLQEGGNSSTAAVRTSVGKLANLQVAVQRRWSNMMTDAIRQQVVEMFLGLKWQSHFPTVPMVYPADVPLEVCGWSRGCW